MAGDSRLSARFGADTSDFKQGITEINRELKLVESDFKATASTMDDWSNNADGLNARMGALTKEIDLQREKVDALRVKHEQMAKANGENSVEAQNAQIEFNKEAEKLGKLQIELNQTGTSLNALKEKSGGLKGALHDMGTQFDNLKQQVPALGTAFDLLSNPISLVVAGIGASIKIMKDAVEQTLAYNKTVQDMSLLTGLSVEETSRIIQVGDDWEINIGTLTSALEMMNKKGVTPSIDNLAKIADQYVAASDKTAFIEAATKKYGKSFGDLIPMLAKGGQALRDNAAAIDDNLIATEDSIKKSRDFKVELDQLNDTFQGLKYSVGNDVIPILVQFLDIVNKIIAANKTGKKDWMPDLAPGIEKIKQGIDEYHLFVNWLNRGKTATAALQSEEDKLNAARKAAIAITGEAAQSEEELAAAQLKYNDAADEYVKRSPLFLQQYAKFTKAQDDAQKALDDAKAAADKLNQTYDDMNLAIDGRLGPSEKDFNSTQDKLNQKMGEIQGQIDNAIKNGYDPLGEKVQGLQSDYNDLKNQYDTNATEHEDATKRIMFNILEQRAAIGGLTAEEISYLGQIATAWGLPDQATLNYMANADASLNWLANHPGDVAGATAILQGQTTAWDLAKQSAINAGVEAGNYAAIVNGIPNKTVYIDTIYRYYGEAGGNAPPGPPPDNSGGWTWNGNKWVRTPISKAQGGVDYVTRPTLFLAGEAGDETVITIPKSGTFGKSLSAIQNIAIQAINGLNSSGSLGGGGGAGLDFGRQLQPATAPINITINGAPDNEMQMRRLAWYVATEIQRKQS